MTPRRWLPAVMANVFAFLLTIGLGVIAGTVLAATQAVEDDLMRKRIPESKRTST